MNKTKYDLVIVGGGPAGLAAAISAAEAGLKQILLVERDTTLGGILNQCIHSGFGLHEFKQELTGPEYAHRFIEKLKATGVTVLLDTMVMQVIPGEVKQIKMMSASAGLFTVETTALILAMGCRERTRCAIATPGARVAGVLTAGTAQRYLNIEGYHVGKRVIILGSGDIGLIMARRLTLEGAKVVACVELMPYSSGLERNISQCLDDFDIPLLLSHTIVDIQGKDRVESVTVASVNEKFEPQLDTRQTFEVDTVLLSVGLIPENELTKAAGVELDKRTMGVQVFENMETSEPGIFACGNVCHVHDLVDFVSAEGKKAGKNAAAYVAMVQAGNQRQECSSIEITCSADIAYTVPKAVHLGINNEPIDVFFRVKKMYKKPTTVRLSVGDKVLKEVTESRLMPGELAHLRFVPTAALNESNKLYLEVQHDA